MNITAEKSNLANVQTIRLDFTPADYNEALKKEVREASKQVNLPGFRAGHVPTSLVERKYGAELLRGVVQKQSEKAVNEYLEENGMVTVGGILPNPKQETYEVKPGENLSFIFDLLVVPQLEIPSDLQLECVRPVFNDEYWARYDKRLTRLRLRYNGQEGIGEGVTLHLSLSVPVELPEGEERSANEEQHWSGRHQLVVDWDELTPELQELLRGKNVKDTVVLTPEQLEHNRHILSWEYVEGDLTDPFRARVQTEGVLLTVRTLFSYEDRELTKEILLASLAAEEVDKPDSYEELLGAVHAQHERLVQLALKIASAKTGLERLASEWEFEIPIEVVSMILMLHGAKSQDIAWRAFIQRTRLREEGFFRVLHEAVKDEAKQIMDDPDRGILLLRMLLGASLMMSREEEGLFFRLLPEVQTLRTVMERSEQDERYREAFYQDRVWLNTVEAFFNKVDVTFKDVSIDELSWRESFFYVGNHTLKFRGSDKDLAEFEATLSAMNQKAEEAALQNAEGKAGEAAEESVAPESAQ